MSKLSDLGLDLEQRRKITHLALEYGCEEYLRGWYSAKRDAKHKEHNKNARKKLRELSDYICWTEDL